MTEVFRLADTYVDELCALDPFTATDLGLPGHDDEVTDFSPEGVDARADLARRTIRALDSAAVENDADRIAAAVMRDRLDAELEGYQAGAPWRQLSNFDSPLSFIRMAFDLGPGESPDDWERIATRMSKVPELARRLHDIASVRPGDRKDRSAPPGAGLRRASCDPGRSRRR